MSVATIKSDAEIKREVLEELKWDPRVDETEVGVQVRGGVVTLVGTLGNYAKKLAAEEAAHRVAGVLDVADELRVLVPGVGRRSDTEIATAVRAALEWEAFVPDKKIRSTVQDGWVTLEGGVDLWSQRQDAERVVQRLEGVRGVTNRIAVQAPKVDAAALRVSIEHALERQAEREGKRIGVSVEDGVVTLAGTVRSWSERNTIDRVVGFAPGVRRVEDRLIVDPCA